MMLGIIKWNLWQRRYSILWWSIGVTAFIAINLIFYPTFREQAAELNKSLEQLPDAAKSLFAGSGDFTSPVGYVNSQVYYLMLPMLLGILGISLGSSMLAKEERDGTLELLLARPVSRFKLLVSKIISSLLILLAVSSVALIAILALSSAVSLEVSILNLSLAWAYSVVFALNLMFFTLLIASIGRTGKAASIGLATFFGLGGYIISSLSSTVTWLEKPSLLFPFHYYRPEGALNGLQDFSPPATLLVLSLIFVVLSYLAFRQRDIG